MRNSTSQLVEYILLDDSSIKVKEDKVIEAYNSEGKGGSLNFIFPRYVRGSVPEILSDSAFSKIPKEGEYLISSTFLGFCCTSTIYPIKEINFLE